MSLRILSLLACVLTLCLCAAPNWAQPVQYDLLYNPVTGNVTIDSLDPNVPLRSIRLNSPGNQLNPVNLNNVLPLQFASPLPPPTSDQIWIAGVQPATPAQAVLIDPTVASNITGTRWDMGNILPTGLDAQGLENAIPNARFHPARPRRSTHSTGSWSPSRCRWRPCHWVVCMS